MKGRLVKVKEFIYELLYAKVVETFENANLSHGTVKLPALTGEDWMAISVMSQSAGLYFNYAARESIAELFDIESIYKKAINDYLINERKIHEVPAKGFTYSVF